MDFGQYTEDEVFAKLREQFDKGDPKGRLCERCGNKTKAGKIFGIVICKRCWDKQIHPEENPEVHGVPAQNAAPYQR